MILIFNTYRVLFVYWVFSKSFIFLSLFNSYRNSLGKCCYHCHITDEETEAKSPVDIGLGLQTSNNYSSPSCIHDSHASINIKVMSEGVY